jgi:glucose/arabinose dehydrogenase
MLTGGSVERVEELLKNKYGRIRDVVTGPGNMLYITTSNLDGRGSPKTGDDKIVKLNPDSL